MTFFKEGNAVYSVRARVANECVREGRKPKKGRYEWLSMIKYLFGN